MDDPGHLTGNQFSLPDRTRRLMDCNFLTRTSYKDVY